MAEKDWPRGRGEASSLSNLKIVTRHIDPSYDLIEHDLKREDNRLLKVFSLISKSAGQPGFLARVDDGSPDKRKDPELDFDILGVGDDIRDDFKRKNPRLGYSGHHSDRSPNVNYRVFDVEIKTPGGVVFSGEVSFNATFAETIATSVTATASCDITVIRGNQATKN
jgi:hypothetical protein